MKFIFIFVDKVEDIKINKELLHRHLPESLKPSVGQSRGGDGRLLDTFSGEITEI